jgi:hypothetical protein
MSKKIPVRGRSAANWRLHQRQDADIVVRFECRVCGQAHPTAAHDTLDALNLHEAPAEVRARHERALRRWRIGDEKNRSE